MEKPALNNGERHAEENSAVSEKSHAREGAAQAVLDIAKKPQPGKKALRREKSLDVLFRWVALTPRLRWRKPTRSQTHCRIWKKYKEGII